MANDSSATFDADARNWALGTLDLTDAQDLDDARLLRYVSAEEYVLDAARVDAIEIVSNRLQAAQRIAHLGCEQRLRASVEVFARRFFQLDPPQRTCLWHSLKAQCQNTPALNRWLDDLSPGLPIATPDTPDEPALKILIENCQVVFVTKSLGKIRIRQQFFETMAEDAASWWIVVDQLHARYPEFACNVGGWLEDLSQLRSYDKDAQRMLQAIHRNEFQDLNSQTAAASPYSPTTWFIIYALVAGLPLGAAISRMSPPRPSPGTAPPSVQFPQPNSPPSGNPVPQLWQYPPPRQPGARSMPQSPRRGNGGQSTLPSPPPFQPGRR